MFMAIQEIKSRLYYIRVDSRLEVAYGNSETPFPVEKGRCLCLVRLELALEGHPEINDDRFNLDLRTTKDGIYFSKGLGGGKRGWLGEEIPFERFIEKAQFPNNRTDTAVDKTVRDALADILRGYNYNCNFRVFSEFEGFRDGLGHIFDQRKTYMPIIVQAVKEVQPKL